MLANRLRSGMKNLFRSISLKPILASLAAVSLMVVVPVAASAATTKHKSKKVHASNKHGHKTKTAHVTKNGKKGHQLAAKQTVKSKHAVARHVAEDDVIERPSNGDIVGLKHTQDPLALASNVAFVVDQDSSKVLFEKNSDISLPIASITKLMTSLVVVEAKLNLDEMIEITTDDLDKEKGTGSRLQVGAKLSRADLLHIALMSSENRAASALGRNYPGGLPAFVNAMNAKAKQLGMDDTHYVDSSGLSSKNVASARDLVKLINAAYQFPLIREYSTDSKYVVNPKGKQLLEYGTTNKLVADSGWNIGLQKTGYIAEAGRCLVMQAIIEGRAVVMVFLDSKGKYSRIADAGRIKKWLHAARPAA